jgi:hypothetical protein
MNLYELEGDVITALVDALHRLTPSISGDEREAVKDAVRAVFEKHRTQGALEQSDHATVVIVDQDEAQEPPVRRVEPEQLDWILHDYRHGTREVNLGRAVPGGGFSNVRRKPSD